MKKLLVVESPAKARTISNYLDKSFDVIASVGHIRDLPKSNKKAIDIEGGFIPNYEIVKGKQDIVDSIKKKAKNSHEVLLATDPDREGEAIAWHIVEACELKNPKRIVFHEITKSAVEEAINHARRIDTSLRRAQEARRVLDRLVGYDLSGLIWKKVRYGLSAGRVQSPALRILMEREREIRAHNPEKFWVITALLKDKDNNEILFTCTKEPNDKNEVLEILKKGKSGSWTIVGVKETNVSQKPRPPFITSTLQQSASTRLGYAPSRTMGIAQKLYEAGHITYMRTDSTTIGVSAQKNIVNYVENAFGKKYACATIYKTKSKNAQEAHEAIRITDVNKKNAGTTDDQKNLYNLIWSRTIASQMAEAKTLRTKISSSITDGEIPLFHALGQRIIFDGWMIVDKFARKEDVELPKRESGDSMELISISDEEKETQPLNRYSEAGLIKELEKRDIGRPSTYASIMRTLVDRGYVEKTGRTLFPTDTGEVVNSFLEEHFADYISDSFTAEMEEELDEIAGGKRNYTKTLTDFYKPFHKKVIEKGDAEKITNLGNADKEHRCPACKSDMIIKLGRSGKFLSCNKFPECVGARGMDGIELAGPKSLGKACPLCEKGDLLEREGKFGKFVGCNKYPKCKFIMESEETKEKNSTGVSCPKCNKGVLSERRGRFGVFFGCSNYPKCKFAIKARPTGNNCTYKKSGGEICNALEMEGTKTIPNRCSDKECPNHNPHKL